MIPTSELNLFLELTGRGAIYVRVAEAVLKAIRECRIPPGGPLPGIRELAPRLGVHRNTVLAALRELEAQGWLQARPRQGFYVADPLPEAPAIRQPRAVPPAQSLGFDLANPLGTVTDARGLLRDFSDGVADARLVPVEALAQAYVRGLRSHGPELLQSSEFKGLKRLRTALAEHLAQKRGLRLDPEQLLIVRSTSMAVTLAAQTLLGARGGRVAVETPGNAGIWDTLRQAASAELVGIPVDQDGLDPDALEARLREGPIALLVTTPQCHYPTGAPLSPARRGRVLELASRHRFAVLELDPEFDYLPYALAVHPPLASLDRTGQVIYVGSLSRTLAPGLRLGYMGLPSTLADRLARARQHLDWQGDPLLEWVVSELILDGEYRRHLRRLRKAHLERREALLDALRHGLEGRLESGQAQGGMALWLTGAGPWRDPARFEPWVRACTAKGFKLRPGRWFMLDGTPIAATRFGFTACRPEELQQAVALCAGEPR